MLHILALDKHIIRLSIDSDIQNTRNYHYYFYTSTNLLRVKRPTCYVVYSILEFQQIYTSEIIVVNIPIKVSFDQKKGAVAYTFIFLYTKQKYI